MSTEGRLASLMVVGILLLLTISVLICALRIEDIRWAGPGGAMSLRYGGAAVYEKVVEAEVKAVLAPETVTVYQPVSPLPTPPSNLIHNPGFEGSASDYDPADWLTAAYQESDIFMWDNTQAHTGHRSARITANFTNDARWEQIVPVMPHTVYELSGWIKTEGVVNGQEPEQGGANLGLYGTWDHTPGLTGFNDWTYTQLRFDSGQRTQVMVACRLGYWSGTAMGIMWCDDLMLRPLGPSS